MAIIVTNPNYIQVDGARIQKGSRDIIPLENGVRLQNTGSGSVIDILVDGTTIDGVAVADQTELLEYLDSQGFKSGGSSPGTEVSWDDITDKPAVIASGDTQAAARTTLGLGSAATSAASAFATAAQGGLADTALQPPDATDVAEAGKIVKYSSIGSVNTVTPQFPENAVNLAFLDSRISADQRTAINALVSPTEDYVDIAEATAAIKSIIDALKA